MGISGAAIKRPLSTSSIRPPVTYVVSAAAGAATRLISEIATAAEKLDACKAWILPLVPQHPVWQQAGDSHMAQTSVRVVAAGSLLTSSKADTFDRDSLPVARTEQDRQSELERKRG